jgi:hypothetical protein
MQFLESFVLSQNGIFDPESFKVIVKPGEQAATA